MKEMRMSTQSWWRELISSTAQLLVNLQCGRRGAAATLILICVGLLSPVRAHEAIENNVYLSITDEETKLVFELDVPTFLMPPLADLALGDELPVLADRRAALERFLGEQCPLLIDGLVVAPIVSNLSFLELEEAPHQDDMLDFLSARVVLRYPLKTPPARIDMTWAIFAEEPPGVDEAEHSVDDLLAVSPYALLGGRQSFVIFTPAEPQFVWHRPNTLPPMPVIAEPAIPPWRMPKSVPIACAFLGIGLLLPRRKACYIGSLAALFAAAAFACWPAVEPPAPPLPSSEMAAAHFAQLHANIYRAFDYDEQEAVYDALAQSVHGALLERLYIEIYESLILRDEGGVVAKVQKVDTKSIVPRLPLANSANAVIEVDCVWQVHGYVRHWEHTHRRVNEYAATYAMRRTDDTWKITAAQTTRQDRLYAEE